MTSIGADGTVDASRELPQPTVTAEVAPHTVPKNLKEALSLRCLDRDRSERRKAMVDGFAGVGKLGKVFSNAGWETRAYEAYPDGKTLDANSDLTCAAVVTALIQDILGKKFRYLAFGIPCKSWTIVQFSFGGSRTYTNPWGSKLRPAELEGNLQLRMLLRILWACVASNTFFTIENPMYSLIWSTPELIAIGNLDFVEQAVFDMCAFGLRTPPGVLPVEIWKKPGRLIGHLPHLSTLSRRCPKGHKHGSLARHAYVTLADGRRAKKISLAGAYPSAFCRALLHLVEACSADGAVY
ncbi:MAG: hypothetical protein OSB41_14635 [Kiritimatiellae bacterium]|nr:hypothetical protein [Kiritimatiellia bacterium]